MSTHTPGPWRWCGNWLLQDVPARDGGDGRETNPFSTPCGHPIADDGSAGGEYSTMIDVNGPDAHLIAAAPDLLKALKGMVARFYRDGGAMLSAPEVVAAESAISRAEGKGQAA